MEHNILLGLEILGKGIAGIFAVSIIIMIFIMILNRCTKERSKEE